MSQEKVFCRRNDPLPDRKTIRQMIDQGNNIYNTYYRVFADLMEKAKTDPSVKAITQEWYEEFTFEFFKALPGIMDRLFPTPYENFIKGKFNLTQENAIYAYTGNVATLSLATNIAKDYIKNTGLKFEEAPKEEAKKPPKTKDFGLFS